MSLLNKIRRATRGGVTPAIAFREALRRSRAAKQSRWERRTLDSTNQAPPRLAGQFTPDNLLVNFTSDRQATFLPGFATTSIGDLQRKLFPRDTEDLERRANQIVNNHTWELLGFGEKYFGEKIEWRRDPLSAYLWPLDYHRDIPLLREDGSDIRVLWELNRLGHLLTLARTYAVTNDELLSREFFLQIESWSEQNPFGRGPNWSCAMEVALRAINLLGAFEIFRHSSRLTAQSLLLILRLFQQHGTYITNNLEFSYLATSNHYFSDVVGLLWLGTLLPELQDSKSWADVGLVEMLSEMDKQILSDGADFESSTGYHRFVLELVLYSFILCRANSIKIADKYWRKLHAMLRYLRSYLRPDGMAPLIGDSDSGQILQLRHRRANDHGYLLAIGAVLFDDPELKIKGLEPPEELPWLLGQEAVAHFQRLEAGPAVVSEGFPDAGLFIMRDRDLYLCFNASGPGLKGRGSHGHNDALSVEVSACGQPFIVDPGTYVYTADLQKRHHFRSTAYHSTVRVDGVEQNTTEITVPFVIGDEALPRLLRWESRAERDVVSAEHSGYARLSSALVHRRSVIFDKPNRFWLIEDELIGEGEHAFEVRFHFAPRLEITIADQMVAAHHQPTSARLFVWCSTTPVSVALENQFTSFDYGNAEESVNACLKFSGKLGKLTWFIVPVCDGESVDERLRAARKASEVRLTGDS